jgi:hypothetical protein
VKEERGTKDFNLLLKNKKVKKQKYKPRRFELPA